MSKWNCHKCDKTFNNRSILKDHIKINHPEEFKCEVCEMKFVKNHELEKHITVSHDQFHTHKCEMCCKIFATKWRLEKHKRAHFIVNRKKCHFFNNEKPCPFEIVGCKFQHKDSKMCYDGEN